jgi:hypothetical protein
MIVCRLQLAQSPFAGASNVYPFFAALSGNFAPKLYNIFPKGGEAVIRPTASPGKMTAGRGTCAALPDRNACSAGGPVSDRR